MTGPDAVTASAAVEIEDLHKRYGDRDVLGGISLRIAAGETFALIGPNGAGKTTTVEILEGYRRADAGRVRVLGVDPAGGSRDHRARVGLMLQGGGGIDPRMAAGEVLALHARLHAAPRDPGELLERVGLTDARSTRFRRLSGGERQRLGVALALVGRPELVILDEPTAGMDVEARTLIRALLGELRRDGVTVLMASHDLTDVERVADRIAILDRGRIVAEGSPASLAGAGPPVLRFRVAVPLAPSDLAALGERLGPIAADGGGRYRIDGTAATPTLVAALARWCEDRGLLLAELRAGGATLEERYVEILAAAEGAPEHLP
ncbi:MAG TPA: ABC transporter ATP-binding protein [Candidatus Limnocylindrales bacterium]|nr:ABC transporter ATP-binding protein [Candidatus Limnocylindrales bacterium]